MNAVPKQPKRMVNCYLRDDGELMIEVQPGEFVSETAAQRGLVDPSVLTNIASVKGRLKSPSRALSPRQPQTG
jgi:hypothetical protein